MSAQGQREVLWQLFRNGPTWDGNIVSKPDRDELIKLGLVAREKANMTQADLASLIGLSRPAVANIELGRQGTLLHTALDIAAALNASLTDDLLRAALDAARRAEIQALEGRLAALRAEPTLSKQED